MLVESDDDVGAVGYYGDTYTAADLAPLPQRVYVFGDVELLELTPLLLEPILDPETMGSGRGGVDLDVCHGVSSVSELGWRSLSPSVAVQPALESCSDEEAHRVEPGPRAPASTTSGS